VSNPVDGDMLLHYKKALYILIVILNDGENEHVFCKYFPNVISFFDKHVAKALLLKGL